MPSARQVVALTVPDCTWLPPDKTSGTTVSVNPLYPIAVNEWQNFFYDAANFSDYPAGNQFPFYPAETRNLSVKRDVEDCWRSNVLMPIEKLLPQG
ncbi:3804_t:CDS:1, partial [Paraglomus brasilianum]